MLLLAIRNDCRECVGMLAGVSKIVLQAQGSQCTYMDSTAPLVSGVALQGV